MQSYLQCHVRLLLCTYCKNNMDDVNSVAHFDKNKQLFLRNSLRSSYLFVYYTLSIFKPLIEIKLRLVSAVNIFVFFLLYFKEKLRQIKESSYINSEN